MLAYKMFFHFISLVAFKFARNIAQGSTVCAC